MKTKICLGCGKRKRIDQYYPNVKKRMLKTGPVEYVYPHPRCKPCMKLDRQESKEKARRQTYAKEYARRPEPKEKNRLACAKHRKDFPGKTKARTRLHSALKRGNIIKPTNCSKCGKVFSVDKLDELHAHHPDYRRPLNILWLCRKCHADIHSDAPRKQRRPERRHGIFHT